MNGTAHDETFSSILLRLLTRRLFALGVFGVVGFVLDSNLAAGLA